MNFIFYAVCIIIFKSAVSLHEHSRRKATITNLTELLEKNDDDALNFTFEIVGSTPLTTPSIPKYTPVEKEETSNHKSISEGKLVGDSSEEKKIAFLFLTRGPMPLEDVWREFFRWRAKHSQYSVYVHPHSGYR